MKTLQKTTLLGLFFIFFVQFAYAETIYISGSTTVRKYIKIAAHVYEKKHPEAHFFISGGGSTSGFGKFIDGRTHIGMMSRDLTTNELDSLGDNQTIMIAWDAIVPIVSKEVYENDHVTAINILALKDIYQAKITNWQDIGGRNTSILVVDKTTNHGTRQVFAQRVLGSASAPHINSSIILEDNQDVANIVISSDQTIAYLSTSYNNPDLYKLALGVNGEVIKASQDNIRSAKYPLSRKLILLLPKNIPQNIQSFIDFILSNEGQVLVSQVGYIPIH